MKVRVKRRYRDVNIGRVLEPGEVVDMTAKRLAEVEAKLPNHVERMNPPRGRRAGK